MDSQMQEYITGIKLYVQNARTQCHYAALANDSKIDNEEQRKLRRLDKAVERFLNELSKI